jgi:hypothetical protein
MHNDRGPRMTLQDYDRCLTAAATARTAEDIARIRSDVLRRWGSDPSARDLAETLCAHEALVIHDERSHLAALVDMMCVGAPPQLQEDFGRRSSCRPTTDA